MVFRHASYQIQKENMQLQRRKRYARAPYGFSVDLGILPVQPLYLQEQHQIAREALKKMHIDPFDNEYDRFNGSEMELLAEAYARDDRVVLDTPVDLNVEMDFEQMPDDILESLKPNVHTKEENELYQFDDEM